MKPVGNRYLDAEKRFFKCYNNKKLVKEVKKLLDLQSTWFCIVFVNIMKERDKQQIELEKAKEIMRIKKKA